MEELIRTIIDNGLGVASFIALIYFANSYMKTQAEVLKGIKETLTVMCDNLKDLTGRVEVLEQREANQTNKLNELTNNNTKIIEEQKNYAQPAQVQQMPVQQTVQEMQHFTTEPPVIQPVEQVQTQQVYKL